MTKAISISTLLNRKYKTLPFEGAWLDAIGQPQVTGSWLIWAESFNGKTTFSMQLAKYLCSFGKVYYNSLEEGDCESMRITAAENGLADVQGKFLLLDREPLDQLSHRMKKRPPKFVFIDSVQYAFIDLQFYKQLTAQYPRTVFIWISHAEGKKPKGALADAIRYDAHVKIRIEGYLAFINSRYRGNGEPYTIYPEGAEKYWGKEIF